MITHDLGVVAGLCDEVNVLYGGRVVERAERHALFHASRHPYTHGLLASIPRLDAPRGEKLVPIKGSVADNLPWEQACAFAPRCPNALEHCRQVSPELVADNGGMLRCHNPVGPMTAPKQAVF
jgi:peptide/nickel transport system ATP-binding protein